MEKEEGTQKYFKAPPPLTTPVGWVGGWVGTNKMSSGLCAGTENNEVDLQRETNYHRAGKYEIFKKIYRRRTRSMCWAVGHENSFVWEDDII